MNTGRAPQYRIGLQLPTKVSDEQNTVSPGFTPSSSSARWIAAVPELTRRGVADADMAASSLLEAIDVRAQRRDPVGAEGLLDECGFLLAQVRRRQPDALRELAARDEIHRQAVFVNDRNMGDAVLAQECWISAVVADSRTTSGGRPGSSPSVRRQGFAAAERAACRRR